MSCLFGTIPLLIVLLLHGDTLRCWLLLNCFGASCICYVSLIPLDTRAAVSYQSCWHSANRAGAFEIVIANKSFFFCQHPFDSCLLPIKEHVQESREAALKKVEALYKCHSSYSGGTRRRPGRQCIPVTFELRWQTRVRTLTAAFHATYIAYCAGVRYGSGESRRVMADGQRGHHPTDEKP